MAKSLLRTGGDDRRGPGDLRTRLLKKPDPSFPSLFSWKRPVASMPSVSALHSFPPFFLCIGPIFFFPTARLGISRANLQLGCGSQRFHLEKQPVLECRGGAARLAPGPSQPGMHFAAYTRPGLGSMEFLLSAGSFVSVKKKYCKQCMLLVIIPNSTRGLPKVHGKCILWMRCAQI